MSKKADKTNKNFAFLKKAGLFVFLFLLFFGFLTNYAKADLLGTEYAAESGLSQSDPRLVMAEIVKISLGLLGIADLILMLYAGFVWMTSLGDSQKIEKAKKTIWGSVVGLAIILSAYAITYFVVNNIFLASIGSKPRTGSCILTGGVCDSNVDCPGGGNICNFTEGYCFMTGDVCYSNTSCPVAGDICNTSAGTCTVTGSECYSNVDCHGTGDTCQI